MPELFRLFGIRFFFFSNEHLPIHVHIENGDGDAKFEVKPVKLISNNGIKNKDIKLAESIIEENEDMIEKRWNEYFKK
ncbi:MAG: hypothetical protein JWQ34_2232 [Mucilaginibacter sp.]|uniref:DUF4160 domain-containing protein n=1 Tax=Mucilaginibacter sp. TaxID=1882438 RepID=UPI002606A9F2|nr:DUF4160 domain-containing protein [Mucilaginibacter sp.]MDB5004007.1 hypothetical protein [Mucilaginibacter sp.]